MKFIFTATLALGLQFNAPVVELRLEQPHNAPWMSELDQQSHRREQMESQFASAMEKTFQDELNAATPMLKKTVRDLVANFKKEHGKSFVEIPAIHPDSMIVKVADSKPIAADILAAIKKHEKEMDIQEMAALRSSFAVVHHIVDTAVSRMYKKMLSKSTGSKVFLGEQEMPFDLQIENPRVPYMKVGDAVSKLAQLRSTAMSHIQGEVQSLLTSLIKSSRASFVEQPRVSVGSPGMGDSDLSSRLNEIMQGANSIVSVGGGRGAETADKATLDKAADDMKSVTNAALTMQGAGLQFLSIPVPVSMGTEVKNRLFDTEPMAPSTVPSLNVFVENDSRAANLAKKMALLQSQEGNWSLEQALKEA